MSLFEKLFKGRITAAQPVATEDSEWKTRAEPLEKMLHVILGIAKCGMLVLMSPLASAALPLGAGLALYGLFSMGQGGLRLVLDPYKNTGQRMLRAYAQSLNPFSHPFTRRARSI